MRGERIQIPLKTGHHLPASETPFNDGPTLNVGLVALCISRVSGPILLRKHITLFFFSREGGPNPLSARALTSTISKVPKHQGIFINQIQGNVM